MPNSNIIKVMKLATFFLLFLSASLLLILSVLVPSLHLLIWFAFVPFLLLIRRSAPLLSLLLGTGLGFVFLSAFFYWIVFYEVRIFLLVTVLAVPFIGLFSVLTSAVWSKTTNPFLRILAPPVLWSTASFLYSFTPLEILGDQISIFSAPSFPLIVSMTGISGITFLILLSNSILTYWIAEKKDLFRSGLIVLLYIVMLGILPATQSAKQNALRVALIQHNFPIPNDWRFFHQNKVLEAYEEAIRSYGPQVDLVVFPQYGLPVDVLREPDWLLQLARLTNASILLGTYLPKQPGGDLAQGERTDSAVLFTPEGKPQEYQSVTAPPFRQISQVLGTERKPLLLGKIKIGAMLCYEDVLPRAGIQWSRNGAELLFALSNPGHFLNTRLPEYHLLHDRIRAIETGRFIARVSPNGYSALIDPSGKVLRQTQLGKKAVILAEIYPAQGMTFFTRFGNLILPVCAAIAFLLFIRLYQRDWRKRLARKKR